MLNYFWPIMLVVGANIIYNLCAKSIPSDSQPFASLIITYLTAGALSILLFFTTSENKNLVSEMHKTNWTAFLFGVSIVLLELGYIYVYRVGWKMGTGSLIANILLACILLAIGVFFYKETITAQQMFGILLCIIGIILINK